MLRGKHLSSSPHSRLHLVGDDQHTILLCDTMNSLEKRSRRDEITSLALDRFDDNRGTVLGRYRRFEEQVFNHSRAMRAFRFKGSTALRLKVIGTTVTVG